MEAARVYEEAYTKMKFNLENLKSHNAILWRTAHSLQQSLLQQNAEEPADVELMAAARAKILNEKIASIRDSTVTQHRKNLINGGGELAELDNIKHRLEAELRTLDHTKTLAVQRLDSLGSRPLTAAEVRDASSFPKVGGQAAEVRRHLAEENRLLEHKVLLLERAQQEEARAREELVLKTKQECSVIFAKIAREVLTKLIAEC